MAAETAATPSAEPLQTIRSISRKTGVPYLTLRRLVALERIPSISIAGMPPRLRLSEVQSCFVQRGTIARSPASHQPSELSCALTSPSRNERPVFIASGSWRLGKASCLSKWQP